MPGTARRTARKRGFTVTGIPYRVYIASPEWEAVKARYRASKLPQTCAICGASKVQLHHRTYKRLGAERLMDLVPLCDHHHRLTHTIVKSKTSSRISLWNAHKRARRKKSTLARM